MYCLPFLRTKGPFHSAPFAKGNVNYTLQRAFHISPNLYAHRCLHWLIVSCYNGEQIHLALWDNEYRMEQLPLLLSWTTECLQLQHSTITQQLC